MTQQFQSFAQVHDMLDDLVTNVKFMASQARLAQPGSSTIGNDAGAAERTIHSQLLSIGQVLFAGFANEVGNGDEGFRITHNSETYKRRIQRTRTLLTVFGEVPITRCTYYAERPGRAPYVPTDARLNLPDRQHSYFVQQLLSRLTLKDTHREAVDFFEELFGRKVSTMTTDHLMPEIAADTVAFNETLTPKLPEPSNTDKAKAEDASLLQVISFDGKGVPIIKEQSAQQTPRLTKGKKRQQTKEALVGLEYLTKPNVREAHVVARNLVLGDTGAAAEDSECKSKRRGTFYIHYESSLTDKYSVLDTVGERVDARQEAVGGELDQVCLVDGAERLISRAKARFPEATVVLDIIHVTEYLWKAAHALHGEGSPKAKAMVLAHLERILEGSVGRVIGGLRQRLAAQRTLSARRREAIERAISYFVNHRQYMEYGKYLAAGYPIGTGVVESACGHLVKQRMSKAGARWSLSGAEAMLRLRAIYASGNWKAFLEFREKREHCRLHQTAA
jgi:hypothetical protein